MIEAAAGLEISALRPGGNKLLEGSPRARALGITLNRLAAAPALADLVAQGGALISCDASYRDGGASYGVVVLLDGQTLRTTSYIFAARTAMFIAAVPFMVLLYIMAACDGLSARSIRRACAGRESSSLYHRGKLGQALVVSTAT